MYTYIQRTTGWILVKFGTEEFHEQSEQQWVWNGVHSAS
jgi:hypothetical protein